MCSQSKRRAVNLPRWRPWLETLEARLAPGACFWESGRPAPMPQNRVEASSQSAKEIAPPEITAERPLSCETYAFDEAVHASWSLKQDSNDPILRSPSKHPIDDPWSDDLSRPSAVRPHYGGYGDGAWDNFVSLGSSTYLGGFGPDDGHVIALNRPTGWADSTHLPTLHPVQTINTRGANGLMTELNAYGTLAYSTYLRGYPAQGINGRPTDSSASVSEKPRCQQESATGPAEALRSGDEGCCFVLGQEPFPATRQECDKVGGRFNPDPCPLA